MLNFFVDTDDDDDIKLPSNVTKRGMYEWYFLDLGYVANASGKGGSYGKVSDYNPRITVDGSD